MLRLGLGKMQSILSVRIGKIFRFANNTIENKPVLDITDLTKGQGERGLLGLAFSLDGATAYINYTNRSGDTTIASVGVARDGMFARETLSTILVI